MEDEHIESKLLIIYLFICHLSGFEYISSEVPQKQPKKIGISCKSEVRGKHRNVQGERKRIRGERKNGKNKYK